MGSLGMGLDARQPLPTGDLPRPAHGTGPAPPWRARPGPWQSNDGWLFTQLDSRLPDGLRRLLLLPGSRAPRSPAQPAAPAEALPPSSEHVLLLACGQQPDDASLRTLMEPSVINKPRSRQQQADGLARAWWLLLLGRGRFETWGPGLSWASPAPAPPPNSWWAWAALPLASRPRPAVQARLCRTPKPPVRRGREGVQSPDALAAGVQLLLNEPQLRAELGRIGRRRMEPAGGSLASAEGFSGTYCLKPLRRGAQRLSRTGSGRDRRTRGCRGSNAAPSSSALPAPASARDGHGPAANSARRWRRRPAVAR